MQQLGGADAVDHAQAGALVPGAPGGRGQVLARRDAAPEAAQVVPVQLVEHRAVGGRRGEQHRHPVLGDGRQELPGARPFEQQGARTCPQGEDHEPAEPEGEAERRTAREEVVGARPQHVLGEGVRDRQHVAVEVHAALGPPGGAGRERDQRHVVGGRVDGPVRCAGRRARRRTAAQVVRRVSAERRDREARDVRPGEVVDGPDVAQRVPHPGGLADRAQLVRALLGEHRDRHRARLQHRQPARGQPRGGGAAQQHPVARDDTEVAGQHVRDPVDALAEPAVGPGVPGHGAEGGAVVGRAGEQLGGAVQPGRVAQPGQLEEELRPLLGGRQVVAREGVDMGGAVRVRVARIGHGGSPPLSWWARATSVSCR